jgi:hypothetical protein
MFFLQSCLGPGVPYSRVYETNGNTSLVATLDSNADLRAVMAGARFTNV